MQVQFRDTLLNTVVIKINKPISIAVLLELLFSYCLIFFFLWHFKEEPLKQDSSPGGLESAREPSKVFSWLKMSKKKKKNR